MKHLSDRQLEIIDRALSELADREPAIAPEVVLIRREMTDDSGLSPALVCLGDTP